MPNQTEQSLSHDSGSRTYWLQVMQAGHWRNHEQIADAGAAMVRTGTISQDGHYDAVRLLEACFHMQKGQTEFFEIVVFDGSGARFAGTAGRTGLDHARMDLIGTIAPLVPAAAPVDQHIAPEERAAAIATSANPIPHDSRTKRHEAVPPRIAEGLEGSRALQQELFRKPTRGALPRRDGTRSRLLAGVMVGAFAVGVAVSGLAPEQSGSIAAAIYQRIGTGTNGATTNLARAPKSATPAPSVVPQESVEDADSGWPVAWGDEGTIGTHFTSQSEIRPSSTAQPGTSADNTAPVAMAAFSGKDLEEENRKPGANLVAASLAIATTGPAGSVTQTAAKPVSPAPLTQEEAYAMQASLQEPLDAYVSPVGSMPVAPVQVAESNADGKAEGLHLIASETASPTAGSAFTTAVAGDASQLEIADEFPRPPRKPAFVKERAAYQAALANAIEFGTVEDLIKLITQPTGTVEVASLAESPVIQSPTDLTSLLDFALLQGRPDHAEALAAQGARPSRGILRTLSRSADNNSLRQIAPTIRKIGIDPNHVGSSGMTPLMQAAYVGDTRMVDGLLTLGADPTFETGEGLRAADFAARAKHVDVQETLVLAADQALYTPIMFGLSWTDTLEAVKDRSSVCKQVGEGFVACSLKAETWLDDTAAVIAQFDTRNGNRLVAIQVDSKLYADPDDAEVGFKKAAQLIAKVLPPDQFGFPVRDIPPDAAMFDSLTPAIGTGQYFQYWPDDNLKRPVYVHMKMIGYKRDRGFHRIVIGNPFRVG